MAFRIWKICWFAASRHQIPCIIKSGTYPFQNYKVVIHNIRLPKQSTVGDVLNEPKSQVELSHPDAELRFLRVLCHRIYKIFNPSDKIEKMNDQLWTLLAEEIPQEEKNLGPHDHVVQVYHFRKETAQHQTQIINNFGEPLLLVIREGENLAEVKVRLQQKLASRLNVTLHDLYLYLISEPYKGLFS